MPNEYWFTCGSLRCGFVKITLWPAFVNRPRLVPSGWTSPLGNGLFSVVAGIELIYAAAHCRDKRSIGGKTRGTAKQRFG